MRRIPAPLLVVLLVFASAVFGQTPPGAPVPRPGAQAPTGTRTPGMPPRDNHGGPQTGTATLRGRVVAAQTSMPLRRAQVTLISTEGQMRRVTTTDGEGRYEFIELPAGRFSVSATKAGYVTLQYGQRRAFEAGTPVNLAEGQTAERIDFTLPRGSVITGRITDDFGEPVAGAQVQVQRYQYGPDGQRRLTPVPTSIPILNATDDRGEFRVFGLMPGEYVVSASARTFPMIAQGSNPNDTNEGFAPTFYPGTISPAEATAISVGIGDEASVQFSMVASRMARISGTVVDSEGRPAAGAQLMVTMRQGTGISSVGSGVVAPDGTFSIAAIPPGEHSIDVRPQPRAGTTAAESASVAIVVAGSDITGLQIVTGPGTRISGRVVFQGTSPRTGTNPLRVMPMAADPSRPLQFVLGLASADPLANGVVDEEGNFRLAGATGRIFLNVTTPPGWAVKSVMLDGNDITDEPLDLTGSQSLSSVTITLTDKLTDVSGQVTDGRGQSLRDYVVVIQPAEPKEPVVNARWIRTARPDTNGRFQVRGLRPGRYVATAIETIEQGRQFAPEFQQQLRQSARSFSVREGESITLDLRLTEEL